MENIGKLIFIKIFMCWTNLWNKNSSKDTEGLKSAWQVFEAIRQKTDYKRPVDQGLQ